MNRVLRCFLSGLLLVMLAFSLFRTVAFAGESNGGVVESLRETIKILDSGDCDPGIRRAIDFLDSLDCPDSKTELVSLDYLFIFGPERFGGAEFDLTLEPRNIVNVIAAFEEIAPVLCQGESSVFLLERFQMLASSFPFRFPSDDDPILPLRHLPEVLHSQRTDSHGFQMLDLRIESSIDRVCISSNVKPFPPIESGYVLFKETTTRLE